MENSKETNNDTVYDIFDEIIDEMQLQTATNPNLCAVREPPKKKKKGEKKNE